MKGVDISCWQEGLDLSDVKAAGYDFVIIKAGGSDDGFYTDSCFEDFYKQAKEVGLHVGAYYFVGSNFVSDVDGVADAERFIDILGDKTFDMPVYVDIETTAPEDRAGATTAAIAFCDTMEDAGFFCGIYASEYAGFCDRLEADALTRFTWWVAAWGDVEPVIPWGIWQYSDNGNVSGITVDQNIAADDFPEIIVDGGFNNYGGVPDTADPIIEQLHHIRDELDTLISYVER